MFAQRTFLVFLIQMMVIVIIKSQNPYIQQFTTANGLPSNTVYRIFQDSRKFIWMATDAGVARYDGTNFKYFTIKDGLNTNEVIHIQEDSQGRIWMFNFNGTYNFYFQGKIFNDNNAPFLYFLQSPYVFRKMVEDKEGNLYFHDNFNRDVYILDKHNNVRKSETSEWFSGGYDKNNRPIFSNSIKYLMVEANVYHYFAAGGIYQVKNLQDVPKPIDESNEIERVFGGNKNELFADVKQRQTGRRLLVKYKSLKISDTIYTTFRQKDELINDAFQDKDEKYWITTNSGLFCVKNNRIIFQIPGKIFQNIIQDNEGNIWISTLNSGIFRLNLLVFTHHHFSKSEFNDKAILSTGHRHKGGIWAIDGEMLYLVKEKKVYKSDFYKKNAFISLVDELKNGDIILGQSNDVLRILKEKSVQAKFVKLYPIRYGNQFIKSYSLNHNKDGLVLFYPSLILELHTEKLFESQKLYKFNKERFFSIYHNAEGRLFINGKRIYKFDKGRLIPYKPLQRFAGQIVKQHINLKNQLELFNIGGDSLFLFNGIDLFNLSAVFDPPFERQINYICYNDPYLFLATNSHIYYCSFTDIPEPGSKIELKNLDIAYNNIHHLLIDRGELIISSDDGLTFIPLKSLAKNLPKPPLPYFRNIIINDKPQPLFLPGAMLKGKNKLQFILGNIRYNSSKVLYAYQLEGLDKTWNTGSEQNISYQNLRPGKYVFKFKVKLPSSGWSEEMLYHLEVRPTLYQHPLFFVFGSIFILICLYLFIYYQQKSFLNKQNTKHQILLLEQKALHLTMNPHFIFNSLASIQSYILKNQAADAGNYLSQFARLIRQNLNATKTSMIDLEEEIERLRNYLELEQLRMNFRFSFNISVDENVEDEILIPAMILQPIVENAIWHGLADIESGGMIQISFSQIEEHKLKIIIEDNGIGVVQSAQQKSHKKAHLKIGLELTKKRLEILGKKMNVTTSFTTKEAFPGNPKPGTRVEIISPISFGKNDCEDQL